MLVGLLGVLFLTLLPGAWVTFGLPLKGLSFWIKLMMGVMLSPLVVAVEFYLLRLAGISFQWTSIALCFLNLPVLYLIVRKAEKFPHVDRKAALAGGLFFLIVLIAIAPFLLDPQKRLYTWEAWSQADVIYSLANGSLDLQDAELAGIRLSYPWVGHIFQAVTSFVSNTPPVTNYIWQNLVWLVCIFGFAGAVTAELGGNQFSQVTTAVWLSFGVNIVGVTVQPLVPADWVQQHAFLKRIWGDNRYSPWLDKVVFFGQMYFALGMFIAILYLVLRSWPDGYKRYYLIVTALLLSGLGLIYPVLLPPACIVVGAKVLMMIINLVKGWDRTAWREALGLSIAVLLAVGLTFAYTRFLTQSRTGVALVDLNEPRVLKSRVLEAMIVTSPLLAGLAAVFLFQWKKNREKLIILGLGALGSAVMYILFNIPWWRNEYKFIFTAAICLAPFLALALQPVFTRLGRFAVAAVVFMAILLSIPFVYHTYAQTYELYTKHGPLVDVSHFTIRLDDREPLSGLIDAIRQKTPQNSLLLVKSADFYYPTLTGRQLYAPPDQKEPYPGILVTSEEMITLVKGDPAEILTDRGKILKELFEDQNPGQAIQQILEFNRPLALVLDDTESVDLLKWLKKEKLGRSVFEGKGYSLWVIDSNDFDAHLSATRANHQ